MPLIIVASAFCCVLLVIVAGVAFWLVSIYNGLVKLKTLVDEAWSGIDVQLKRRYDLIPNLVETVKGYAKHESETFAKVTELRNMAINASGPAEQADVENQLSGALKSLFAVAEAYPELKADANFRELQKTLNEVEDEIQSSRRYYNGTVREFNIKIQVFPNNLIAGTLGFSAREFFEAEESERQNVKVDFSDSKADAE